MNILFLKDHGDFHCGCRAVSDFIKKEFGKLGDVSRETTNPDLIVMNGEGSFHHNYGAQYLDQLEDYPGVRKVLVNALWQESNNLVSRLSQFDYINVREILSQKELKRHGYDAKVFLDFSYYGDSYIGLNGSDYKNEIVMGDHFLAFDDQLFGYPKVSFLKAPDLSTFMSSIQGAKLYITGYHHAVYACCKARIPFVPYRHNSHKIEGLFDMAGVNIPIPQTEQETKQAIDWALNNNQEYERLFDFMESYPRWSIREIAA